MSPVPIQQGDTTADLVRYYEVKGPLKLLLDDVIVPVHIINRSEDRGPDPVPAVAANEQAGVGLNNSVIELFNAVGSGVDLELYRIVHTSNATTNIRFVRITAAQRLANAPVFGHWQDFTVPGSPTSRPRGETDADAILALAGTTLWEERSIGSITRVSLVNITIPEGSGIQIQDPIVNQSLNAAFFWREIPT